MKIRILIRKKPGVLDVEGKAVKTALINLNFTQIGEVSKGYFVEIDYNGDKENVETFVKEAVSKLLANDIIETFEYHIL